MFCSTAWGLRFYDFNSFLGVQKKIHHNFFELNSRSVPTFLVVAVMVESPVKKLKINIKNHNFLDLVAVPSKLGGHESNHNFLQKA
jgi:hypothetical protein